MRDNNVHLFPVRGCTDRTIGLPVFREPEQLEFFDNAYGLFRAISYLDIAALDQDRFIRSMIMNAVTTIIDLRGVTVFPKPHFDHRFLMSYFYERSVNYIEFAMVRKASTQHVCSHDLLTRWFSSTHPLGMTACIIDDDAIHTGTVAAFRRSMTDTNIGYIEIHPNALA